MWFTLFQALTVDRAQRFVWQYVSTGFVCLVVVCTALAMALLSTVMYRHFSAQRTHIEQLQQQQRSMGEAQNKLSNYETLARKNPDAFVEYQKHHFDVTYSVEALKDRLTSLQKKLHIEWMNMQHGPATISKNGLSILTVTVDLRVLHDRQFFQFLEHMQKNDMGFFVVKDFDLKRVASNTNKKKTPLFEGRVTLQWFVRQA